MTTPFAAPLHARRDPCAPDVRPGAGGACQDAPQPAGTTCRQHHRVRSPEQARSMAAPRIRRVAAEQHRLPPDSTTKQTLVLPGRTLAFTATAGSIRLFDDKGEPQADIAYTAYQLDGADPRERGR